MSDAAAAGGLDEAADPGSAETVRTTPFWLRVALAIAFGIFYAYDLWEVVGSVVTILALGLGISVAGWVVIVVALIAPIALFVAAFALSRRTGAGLSALCYLTGLAVSAVVFTSTSVLLQIWGVVVP